MEYLLLEHYPEISREIKLYAGSAHDVIEGIGLIPFSDGRTFMFERGRNGCFGEHYAELRGDSVVTRNTLDSSQEIRLDHVKCPPDSMLFCGPLGYAICSGYGQFDWDNTPMTGIDLCDVPMTERKVITRDGKKFTLVVIDRFTWRAEFSIGVCGLAIAHSHVKLPFSWVIYHLGMPMFSGSIVLDNVDCSKIASAISFYGTYCEVNGFTICFTRCQNAFASTPIKQFVFGDVAGRLPSLPVEICALVGSYLGENNVCTYHKASTWMVAQYGHITCVYDGKTLTITKPGEGTFTTHAEYVLTDEMPRIYIMRKGNRFVADLDTYARGALELIRDRFADVEEPPLVLDAHVYTLRLDMRTIMITHCGVKKYALPLHVLDPTIRFVRDRDLHRWASRIVYYGHVLTYSIPDNLRHVLCSVEIQKIFDRLIMTIVAPPNEFMYFVYDAFDHRCLYSGSLNVRPVNDEIRYTNSGFTIPCADRHIACSFVV